MKRPVIFVAMMLFAAALQGAPARANGLTVLHGPMPLIPALSQASTAPRGFTPAPVPNQDVVAPRNTKAPVAGEPQFMASITRQSQGPADGAAFSPGSRFSESMERGRNSLTSGLIPSVGFKVPLDK